MRSRAVFAGALLSSALVSGGWFVERGLTAGSPSSADGARLFDQVFDYVSKLYVDTLSDSTLYVDAAQGVVDELHDPHSEYLSPTLYARLNESTSGRYVGIGTQVDDRDGWVTVVAPLPGGPALAAGIRPGDRIVDVNGESMRGQPIDVVQKALRGAPGSTVRLTVERASAPAPLTFTLQRREIHVQSVQHATLLPNGVGYVAFMIFSESSAQELEHAIDSLSRAGMHALVLDLRENPGGLLEQGVGVADLFLNPGQRIVTMRGRSADLTHTFTDRAAQRWPALPIAVLVDSNTASAAEIVSGALQDHDRAVLLGTTTYGKGSAQSVFPLPAGGAVKLTTALWYTPSGRSLNRPRPGEDPFGADTTASHAKPTYKTDAGRTVLGGGGITPDAVVPVNGDSVTVRLLSTVPPQELLADSAIAIAARLEAGVTSQKELFDRVARLQRPAARRDSAP
ncbi:MAG TPA: S41 family peptidase [Gemmatimonadaceae bacterium]|nr:S41 family peptidase [Gemmatimonadaceae bacterium]